MQNIFRIDKNKVAGRGATHGWQVRIYRGIHHRTKFFSDSKFESSDAALAAALEYREQVYAELGIDTGKYTISAQLAANNTTGIIGVNRSETIEPNATIREFWQTAYPSPTHEVRTKSFGVGRFGEIGALQRAVEARMEGISALIGVPDFRGSQESIKTLIDRYLAILIYLERITPVEEEFLIKTILRKDIKSTDKEDIITGRIGQQTFKDKLVKLFGNRCAVTGARQLLNASHIKPWAKANDAERLDPFNGLLLSPVYDRAFDEGLITFEDSGAIVLSDIIAPDAAALAVRSDACVANLSPFSVPYLEFHRTKIFKGKHVPNKLMEGAVKSGGFACF